MIRLLLLLWNYRKEFEYCKKTGKIPMCSCNEYYKTGNCKHLDKLRLDFKKWIGK